MNYPFLRELGFLKNHRRWRSRFSCKSIFCAVGLNKFPLLKASSRGAHQNWFLNIFKSMFSLQLSIRLSLLWITSSFFFPGCCFTGTCYRYSHFVVLNKGSHIKMKLLHLDYKKMVTWCCLVSILQSGLQVPMEMQI